VAGPRGFPASGDACGCFDQGVVVRVRADMQEYRRAAHFLRDVAGNKARFLRCFALYLAGEKRRAEEAVELTAMTTGRGTTTPAACRAQHVEPNQGPAPVGEMWDF
jgi:hypothetical protein